LIAFRPSGGESRREADRHNLSTTAKRYWAFARAWLLAEISDAEAEKR
jgi:hypothetical protein